MHDEPIFYVYLLKRLDGRPFYAGYGHDNRWNAHETMVRAGKETNHHKRHIIQQILAETGELWVPKEKIAEGLTKAEAVALEIATIAQYGRYPEGLLVNMTSGGDGCRDFPPELRARIAETSRQLMMGNQHLLGHVHSAETRSKISAGSRAFWASPASDELRAKIGMVARANIQKAIAARRGSKNTPEHNAAIGAASKGNTNWLGKSHSDETKAKMSENNAMHRPEERAKISAALKGRAFSEAHIESIKKAQKARWDRYHAENPKPATSVKAGDGRVGREKSPEHRAAISAAQKRRWEAYRAAKAQQENP